MTAPSYDTAAYLAADRFAVFNAAGDSFVSEFAPGLRLRADCGTDGVLLGTVAASSHDAASGRTVVATTMDGGAALTANLAGVLHGNDLPESLCAHAALHAPGGRDALPAASVGASGLVALASSAETQAGANAAKAVTPAGLAASAKGLISTNTTIYVATTGSDTTGTGASTAPYASIAKALASIANKLIASSVIVTIQVADGTYTVSSAIVVDHPDADKIQILGNTSAETTAAISSIDTTAKTFAVAGNHVSNADATKNILVGDIVGVAGSTTRGPSPDYVQLVNGAYAVSGASYDGTNTVIACSSETMASATAGGGGIVIKPCNRCVLLTSGNACFNIVKGIGLINGFTVKGINNAADICLYSYGVPLFTVGSKVILRNATYGAFVSSGSNAILNGGVYYKNTHGLFCITNSSVTVSGQLTVDNNTVTGVVSSNLSMVRTLSNVIFGGKNATASSPAVGTTGGNYGSYVS